MAAWVLIQTGPAAEVRVADALRLRLGEARKDDAYVPMETVWRRLGHRKAPYSLPLIRGYVFAVLEDAELAMTHHIGGVIRVVSTNGRPARIPPLFIEKLRKAEAAGRFDLTRSDRRKARGQPRKVGDDVRIVSTEPKDRSVFDGFLAVVTRLNGKRRAQVLLQLFGRPFSVDLELAKLELAAPPPEPEQSMDEESAAA